MVVRLHCWAVELLQVYCCTAVPLAVAADLASRHLPLPALTTVANPVGSAAAASCGEAIVSPVTVLAMTATTVRSFAVRWRPDSLFGLGTAFLLCGWGVEKRGAGCVRQPVYLAKMLVNCQAVWATPEHVSSFG